MKNKAQLPNVYNGSKKNVLVFILFCSCCLSSHAQKMKKYLHKELRTEMATVCEETPDDNPCAGYTIYLALWFDKRQVQVSEKEVSTCDQESIYNIGTYTWKLLPNKEIKIDFDLNRIKGTYAEGLSLKLRDKQLIGHITYMDGEVGEYAFKEKEKR